MSAEFEALQRAVDANRAMAFPQYPLTAGIASSQDIGEPPQPQLLPQTGSGLSSARAAYHPFKVTIRTNDDDTFSFIVSLYSKVLTDIYPLTTATIVGLAATEPPEPDDAAWKALDPADTIYIEWDADLDTYTIKGIGNGGDWDETNAVTYDGVDQTFARAVIATTVNVDGAPRLVQKVHTDLVMAQWAVEGRIASVFMPHTGAT